MPKPSWLPPIEHFAAHIAAVATVVGAISVVFALPPVQAYLNLTKTNRSLTLEDRIMYLTNSLSNSAQLISQIEQEISKREDLVKKLQSDADQARKISTLSTALAVLSFP